MHLTDHFLPNLIVPVQTNIPLSVNGKIDRRKLYSLYLNNSPKNNLMNIWQVGKFFNFFVLMNFIFRIF